MVRLRAYIGLVKNGRLASLAEACAFLIVASLLLRMLPFRVIALWLDRPLKRRKYTSRDRTRSYQRIRWAVERGSQRLGSTCFPRALAAHAMCRRRGLESVLYYGAVPARGGWNSHAWVKHGQTDFVGSEIAPNYQVLAQFPGTASFEA